MERQSLSSLSLSLSLSLSISLPQIVVSPSLPQEQPEARRGLLRPPPVPKQSALFARHKTHHNRRRNLRLGILLAVRLEGEQILRVRAHGRDTVHQQDHVERVE